MGGSQPFLRHFKFIFSDLSDKNTYKNFECSSLQYEEKREAKNEMDGKCHG